MSGSDQTCRRIVSTVTLIGFVLMGIHDSAFMISLVAMMKPNNSTNETTLDGLNTISANNIRFDWTESQKNALIGVFMWGVLLSQIPLARMSEIFGPKRVIGCCNLLSALLTISLPFLAQIHFWVAISVRFLMGLTQFSLMTCIETVAVRWFGSKERSNLMGKSVFKNLGEGLSFFCSGYIISYFGWPILFYSCGSLELLWNLSWWYFIYDAPQLHPRISDEERREILSSLDTGVKFSRSYKDIPVRAILTNKSVWGMVLGFVFGGASFITYFTYMPIFMTSVLHFTIEENGVLSCLHLLAYFVVGTCSTYFATFLIKSKRVSVTVVRKLFTGVGQCVAGILILSLLIFGASRAYCAIALITAFGMTALCYGGHIVNSMDLAPNFAASVNSVSFLAAGTSSWILTRIINATVAVDNSLESWMPMLIIMAMGYIFSSTAFVLLGSGEIQPFNRIEGDDVKSRSEREQLNKNSC